MGRVINDVVNLLGLAIRYEPYCRWGLRYRLDPVRASLAISLTKIIASS
jgi:hypothetical protein